MSRLGKQVIEIPQNVEVTFSDGTLTVKGPKATLTRDVNEKHVSVRLEGNELGFTPKETDKGPALWGTYASHALNMIHGVTEGFEKKLEIEGVGYRAEMKGDTLVLNMGYSHPVEMKLPEGIDAAVEKNIITITGANKEVVGQFAADVRDVRPPEPYKGKGIRYQGEQIIRKQGKKTA